MAQNNDVKVVVKAKDETKRGLTSANNAVRQFAAKSRAALMNIAAPVAVVTAAVALLKKGYEAVTNAIEAARQKNSEIASGNAEARFKILKESTELLARQFAKLEAAAASAGRVMDARIDAARRLEDAQRGAATTMGLLLATSKEEADAINQAASNTDALVKADRALEDAQRKQADLQAEANRKTQESISLKQQETEAQQAAVANLKRAQELQQSAMAATRNGMALNSEVAKQRQKEADDARTLAAQELSMAGQLQDKRHKLEMEATEAKKKAAIAQADIAAAMQERETIAAQQEAERRIKVMEQEADARRNVAQAEKALADEKAAQDEKVAHEFIKQQQEQAAAAKAKADMTIAAILAEMKADEAKAKEAEKEQKRFDRLMKRQQSGARLSKKDAQFMLAMEQRKQAAGAAAGAQAAAAAAQGRLDDKAMAAQLGKLGALENELKKHNQKLDQLLAMG